MGPVTFTLATGQRVIRGVQRIERQYYNPRSYRGRYPVLSGPTLYLATDSGSGAAASGTGSATIDGQSSPVSYTNPYPHSSVPAGAVMYLTLKNGVYKAVVWDCAGS